MREKQCNSAKKVTRRKCTVQNRKDKVDAVQRKPKPKATRLCNASTKKNAQRDIQEKSNDIPKKSKSTTTRLSNNSSKQITPTGTTKESNSIKRKSTSKTNKSGKESPKNVNQMEITEKSNVKQQKYKSKASKSSNRSPKKVFQTVATEKFNSIQKKPNSQTPRLRIVSPKKVCQTDIPQKSNNVQQTSKYIANRSSKEVIQTDIPQKSSEQQAKSTFQATRIYKGVAKNVRQTDISQSSSKPTTPIVTRLRNCAKKNYIESSPENSVSTTPVETDNGNEMKRKIPIYNQKVVETVKKKEDLYEFDEFELGDAKTKKKINNSSMYDKTMHEVLEKLEKKENRKRTRKKNINNRVILSQQKYTQKVDNVLQNVMVKLKARKSMDKSQKENEVPEKVTNNNNESFSHHKESYKINATNTPAMNKSPQINVLSNIEISPAAVFNSSQWNQDCINSTSVDLENCFGFEEEEDAEEENVQNSSIPPAQNRNHVFANRFNQTISSPAFSPNKFNANSTLIQHPRLGTPCRPQIVQRNQYFIQLKDNALPNLHQEPVLDFSMVENLEERCKKHSTTLDVTKNTIQTSILDYVNNSPSKMHMDQNRSQYEYSLFDAEPSIRKPLIDIKNNQSVIKNAATFLTSTEVVRNSSDDTKCSVVVENKENYPSMKIHDNNNKKRKRAIRSISTDDDNSQEPFFGFDTSSSIENAKNTYRSTLARPFRINFENKQNLHKEKMIARKIDDAIDSVVKDVSNEINDVTNTKVVENGTLEENQNIHIYDDVEREFDDVDMTIKIPNIKYEKKRRKKELDSSASDCEIEKPKKKKKDEMTKDEQAQFDKWVKDFNDMCAEVDKHVLIIE